MLNPKTLMLIAYTMLAGCAANDTKTTAAPEVSKRASTVHNDAYTHLKQPSGPNDFSELDIFIHPQRAGEEGYSVKIDID